jgi:hypothetical protein
VHTISSIVILQATSIANFRGELLSWRFLARKCSHLRVFYRVLLITSSSLLHAITAATHAAKDHRRTKRNDHIANKEAQYHGRDGFVDGQGPDYYNGRSTRV